MSDAPLPAPAGSRFVRNAVLASIGIAAASVPVWTHLYGPNAVLVVGVTFFVALGHIALGRAVLTMLRGETDPASLVPGERDNARGCLSYFVYPVLVAVVMTGGTLGGYVRLIAVMIVIIGGAIGLCLLRDMAANRPDRSDRPTGE